MGELNGNDGSEVVDLTKTESSAEHPLNDAVLGQINDN